MRLPAAGRTRSEIVGLLRDCMRNDARWESGKIFFLVYGVDDEHLRLLQDAYSLYIATNGLGAGSMFPSLSKLEADVVSMTATLLGADGAPGNTTSGGTESILMAVKAARDHARAVRPHIVAPEMVLPLSAHPAFQKAGQTFGIKTVRTPLTAEYVADLAAITKAANDNTIMIVGSAPNYPFGTIDPIEDMARIAVERNIHFHVDACVGAFALPFLRRLGEQIPPFDFSVPGVSTMSADIHKYGFGARGTSVVLYRDEELQEHARFVLDEWCGGPYRTATMAGSRSGGPVAAAWAVLNYFGDEGYLKLNRDMLEMTKKLQRGITAIPGFTILGRPSMDLFAFTSCDQDIMAVGDGLAERGWFLHRQPTNPPSLHVVVTPIHASIIDQFLSDLRDVAGRVMQSRGLSTSVSNYSSR